jgi:hypothetical protein
MIEFKPRYFVLPAIAVAVLAMLHPAASGRAAPQDACAVQARDPGIRASFARFADGQSQTAAKVCALASNTSR